MKKIAKRAVALLFVVALVMSMMVMPTSAAYQKVDHGKTAVGIVINTGNPTSSWRYHTEVIIRNTSQYNNIWVFNPSRTYGDTGNGKTQLRPQTSKVFYLEGKNTEYYIGVQRGSATVEVSTVSRGSIYIDYGT